MKTANIIILMGLPGSGKTYWANHCSANNASVIKGGVYVINMDLHIDQKTHQYDSVSKICNDYGLDHYVRDGYTLVFDGLFTTNKCVSEFIEGLYNYMNNSSILRHGGVTMNIYIHYWNENREQCLKNDAWRGRDQSAKATIQNIPYEKLDMAYLKNTLMDKKVYFMDPVIHDVIVLDTYDKYFDPLNNSVDGKHYSQTWDAGGHWGSCWGDEGEISPEPQPEFEDFDILLEKVAPNITHLQYKRLYRECVTIEEGTEYGYYGSYTYYNRYVLDLKKCYEMLKEMGYIED